MSVILVTAYDVNPYKGSESATGWNFICQIARFNRVIAITRENNRYDIERYINEYRVDAANIQFQYFDLPYWARFWKKGGRGSSVYFYLWQMFLPRFVKRKGLVFDIAHNINFHTDAFPTFLWVLGKPTVWGPINHHEKIPKQYMSNKKTLLIDRLKWCIKQFNWGVDPFILLAKKRVSLILEGSSIVKKRLRCAKDQVFPMSQVASNIPEIKRVSDDSKIFQVLIVGRLVPLKSFDIALRAFDRFFSNLGENAKSRVQLNVIGQGPLKQEMHNLACGLKSVEVIRFIDWVEFSEMSQQYHNASVFLFPSHEGAGMVVAEALSYALPIICFDNYGPGELITEKCGIKIPYGQYSETVNKFAQALLELFENDALRTTLGAGAYELFKEKYTWDKKGNELKIIYEQLTAGSDEA